MRSYEPFSISLSLSFFLSFRQSISHLPRDITFSQKPREKRRTGVLVHTRVRARTNALVFVRALLASAQVQYPWMSVDLVTHIIVKRGLNSNPSRAAGRAYRKIPRCPIFLFLRKCSFLKIDLHGNFLVLVQRDTNVVDGAGKQNDASVGNGISGLTRSRGILGEGAPYRRSLSLLSPHHRSIRRSLFAP